MPNLSTYLGDKIVDHILGRASYTMPTVYVGLYLINPSMPAGTGGVEVSGNAYARQQLSGSTAAASFELAATSAAISFPQATGNWGTVVGLGFFDALTGGNLLAGVPLAQSEVVNSGNVLSFPIGDIVATIT